MRPRVNQRIRLAAVTIMVACALVGGVKIMADSHERKLQEFEQIQKMQEIRDGIFRDNLHDSFLRDVG